MEDAASSLQVPSEQLRASESRRAAVLTLRILAQDVAPAAIELFDPLVADVLKRLEARDANSEAEVSGDGSSEKAATGRGDGNARQRKRGANAGGDAAALRRALAAAIAVISGHTTPPLPRSMITSQEGFVTFLIRAKGVTSVTDAFRAIRRVLAPNPRAAPAAQAVRILHDHSGLAFDLPAPIAKEVHHLPTGPAAQALPFAGRRAPGS